MPVRFGLFFTVDNLPRRVGGQRADDDNLKEEKSWNMQKILKTRRRACGVDDA